MGLSAAVYTQTTDCEVEVNGLMTYDRAVVKLPVDSIAEDHKALYRTLPTIKVLLPTAQTSPQLWSHTIKSPGPGWTKPEFDDSGVAHRRERLRHEIDSGRDRSHRVEVRRHLAPAIVRA